MDKFLWINLLIFSEKEMTFTDSLAMKFQ